ncbi:MAG: type III pantothenate kinase [Candidatus Limnocylindrales bacterium]
MLLAIDVGNTNITLGLVRDGQVTGTRRAATPIRSTVDEAELLLASLLELDSVRIADLDGVVLACVVPQVGRALAGAVARRGLRWLEATAGIMPMPIRVSQPREVGADRLVNALAAGRLYGTPAMVLDFGTATTVDAVAADGAFVGGAIAPGLELGLEALAARTAQLPRVEPLRPARAIGRDTVDAIRSGAVYGAVGLARELLGRIREELLAEMRGGAPAVPRAAQGGGGTPSDSPDNASGAPMVRVILTGGVSQLPWIDELPGIDVIDPDLTLKGLAILAAVAAPSDWSTPSGGAA